MNPSVCIIIRDIGPYAQKKIRVFKIGKFMSRLKFEWRKKGDQFANRLLTGDNRLKILVFTKV